MSKLDDLIEKLCPDGVEYKTLEEICMRIVSGGTPNSKKEEYYNGNIPWLRTQEVDFCSINDTELHISEEGLKNSSAKWIAAKSVVVAMYGATVGKVAWTTIPLTTNQACCNLEIDKSIADYKFVYYCLANQYKYIKSLGQGSQTNISAQIVKQLRLPVPPLEVQREIVRILDMFTLLTAELTEKLADELTARKKQYEFYRDKLLNLGCNIQKYRLNDITLKISDGMHSLPKKITTQGEYPIISAQNIVNGAVDFNTSKYVDEETFAIENKRTNVEKDDVLLTIVGAVGRVAVVKEDIKVLFQRSVCVIKPKHNMIDSTYLKYILESSELQNTINSNAHGAAQKGIYLEQVKNLIIPVPDMGEQKRIVAVLDNLESICNDLQIGLPAEIEARKKQYEYYRDMLLTFMDNSEIC